MKFLPRGSISYASATATVLAGACAHPFRFGKGLPSEPISAAYATRAGLQGYWLNPKKALGLLEKAKKFAASAEAREQLELEKADVLRDFADFHEENAKSLRFAFAKRQSQNPMHLCIMRDVVDIHSLDARLTNYRELFEAAKGFFIAADSRARAAKVLEAAGHQNEAMLELDKAWGIYSLGVQLISNNMGIAVDKLQIFNPSRPHPLEDGALTLGDFKSRQEAARQDSLRLSTAGNKT